MLWASLLSAQAQQTVIPTGSTWRYFKGVTEASSPIDAWRAPAFNDAAWPTGLAPFHYGQNAVGGDDDVFTGTILSDMNGNYSCIFLRHPFTVSDVGSIQALRMRVNYDDGFVAWINGTEVARVNYAGTPQIGTGTPAAHEADPAETITLAPNPASYLQPGVNLLAVQAFNVRLSGSSDFRFETDLQLFAPDADPPVVAAIDPPPGAEVGHLAAITITFSEPVLGVDRADLLLNEQPAATVSADSAQTVFTFGYAPPPPGTVSVAWDPAAGITDEAGNPFAATNRWDYLVLDTQPPTVAERRPVAGAQLAAFTQLLVTFTEPVTGVQAADLHVAGQPAASVSGIGAGPYLFQFPSPDAGTVQMAWAPNHGIRDLAAIPNPFDETPWTVTLDPEAADNHIRINEFVASNRSGLTDETGAWPDWIEIVNAGDRSVNLLGWSLTDDPGVPGKWVFPSHVLAPGEFLVVFASGRDRRSPPYHAAFSLSTFGEYLALFRPESPWTAADALNPAYPEQRNDYSYGRDPTGSWRYYQTPTPGSPNGVSTILGVAPPPHFSVSRGWFNAPFTLLLTSSLAGADIRYTLDGTEPTAASSLYTTPLSVSETHTIRAAAFRNNYLASRTVTHSYLFLDQVPYQPNDPTGYPNSWGSNNNFPGGIIPADYEMDLDPLRIDPLVSTSAIDPVKMQRLTDGLLDLPVVSVVMDPDDMFGPDGLYPNSTSGDKSNNEKPVSVEMWLPDGSTAFVIPGGLDLHGNASRDPHKNPKHGFKLSFRGDYGETSLDYKLFPDSPAEDFDDLILRADFNASWRHWSNSPGGLGDYQRDRATRTRDAFFKHTLRDMGRLASHNRFCHLFINGMYWGTFDFSEQPLADFGVRYFGGAPEDFDVFHQGDLRNGTSAAYNEMRGISNLADTANYEHMKRMLDIEQHIDYMLMHFYVGAQDWGYNINKNWYAIRRRVDGPAGRFQYIPWDGENILLGEGINRVTDNGYPSGLHTKLVASPEYRLAFADRAFRHMLAPDGALTVEASIRRWEYWQAIMDRAIVAESSRWGDYRRDVHRYQSGTYNLYTREAYWLPENQRILNAYLPGRTETVLNQLRSAGLYPSLDAPVLRPHGGRVESGAQAMLSEPGGSVYYTTHGGDPRVAGTGAVSPEAVLYAGPITVDGSMTLRARALSNGVWSALNEADFIVGEVGVPLRITEIMYNPPGGNAYEFLEVMNIGAFALDLSRFSFQGVNYQFPEGTVLGAGAVLLLSSDAGPIAFDARYPAVQVFGRFGGSLSNGGERIAILDRDGRTVTSVHYDDENGWPAAADGGGASLEVIDPRGDPNAPANWRANPYSNGTPGVPPPPPPPPGDVVINELMAHNLSAVSNQGSYPDWIELHNRGAAAVDLGGWSLSDNSNPRQYVIPPSTVLDPGGFLVLWCGNPTGPPGLYTGFALNRVGESLFLFDADTNRVDAVTFGMQIEDLSIGRIDDAWTLTEPTPWAANQSAAFAAANQVAINEWMAKPPPGGQDWLELYNRSATAPVALGGLYLGTSNATSRLPALSYLAPLGFAQFFAEEEAGPDQVDFKLPAAGGMIVLYNAAGAELERVTYGEQTTAASEGRLPDGTSTIAAFPTTPSPGAPNYLSAWTGPVLHEILARNQRAAVSPWGTFADFVELIHPGNEVADLSGMSLGKSPDDAGRWTFPAGASLQPGQTLVIWCDNGRPPSGAGGAPFNTGFGISGDGDRLVVFNAAGQIVEDIAFGPQLNDLPIGRSGGAWQLLESATPGTPNAPPAALGDTAALRFNEWLAAQTSGPDWFELYNPSSAPVALGGLYVTDDPSIPGIGSHAIPSLSFIDAGRWLTFIADGNPGDGPRHVSFSLNAQGETLRLYTADQTLIDAVDFGIQSPDVSEGRLPDGAANIVAFPETASPGDSNYLPLHNVVINEVLTHTDPPYEDAVEFHNPTASPVAIGGWYLSDAQSDLQRYRIPDGTSIPAGGYAVFYQNQFGSADGENDDPPLFAFNGARGDAVYLSQTDGTGALTGYRIGQVFGAAANAIPFGRHPTSIGVDFTALTHPTFGVTNPANLQDFRSGGGQANAPPLVGPIVINEIMYHPAPTDPQDINAGDDEYLELHNLSAQTVPLYHPDHPDHTWRLDNAVRFTFPSGTTLAPGGFLVIVPFDPATDADALARFQSRYGVQPILVGPYVGRLDNAGETVELFRPDTPHGPGHPEAGFVPQILVDRVAYDDQLPWPPEADGGGASLQRDVPSAYGNDPANWRAESPTPGYANFTAGDAPPIITIHPADTQVVAGDPAAFIVTATGAAPLTYQWFHNDDALPDETESTLLLSAVEPGNAGEYRVRVTNPFGATLSEPAAILTVWQPPTITLQPQGGYAPVGGDFTFTTDSTGDAPLTFQWHVDGSTLPTATSPNLTLYNLQEFDSGSYSLRVTNHVGSTWSDPAPLLVIRPPSLENITYIDSQGLHTLLNATPNAEYSIERSTNLTSWTHWITVTHTNDWTPLLDPDTESQPHQFYRVQFE